MPSVAAASLDVKVATWTFQIEESNIVELRLCWGEQKPLHQLVALRYKLVQNMVPEERYVCNWLGASTSARNLVVVETLMSTVWSWVNFIRGIWPICTLVLSLTIHGGRFQCEEQECGIEVYSVGVGGSVWVNGFPSQMELVWSSSWVGGLDFEIDDQMSL